MRVVVIGATGHIGTYLIPRLVNEGHEVMAISRGKQIPYRESGIWNEVNSIAMDRTTMEAEGSFGKAIKELKPDVVIDLVCFTLSSAQQLVNDLFEHINHFIHCGTIWVHGPSVEVPTQESQIRTPFDNYGIQKAEIESYLIHESQKRKFPATVLHPGHIVGPGWEPLNPAGHFNPKVFGKLARGEEVQIPNLGMETVHHVHADDVAQAFQQAMRNWSNSVGESFHVTSARALSLRGYAETIARWFGQQAQLKFLPWEEFRKTVSSQEANATWDHIAHSPNVSIDKARKLLGYEPRYSSLQAVQESVEWLIEHGVIKI